MKPLVHYNEMTDISPGEQRKVCRCSNRCERFVVISYTRGAVLTMCESETKRYITEVSKAIGLVNDKFVQRKKPWTQEEVKKLKQYYKKHNGSWGYVKRFSSEIGRTNDQIRQKIRYLKEKGELI